MSSNAEGGQDSSHAVRNGNYLQQQLKIRSVSSSRLWRSVVYHGRRTMHRRPHTFCFTRNNHRQTQVQQHRRHYHAHHHYRPLRSKWIVWDTRMIQLYMFSDFRRRSTWRLFPQHPNIHLLFQFDVPSVLIILSLHPIGFPHCSFYFHLPLFPCFP